MSPVRHGRGFLLLVNIPEVVPPPCNLILLGVFPHREGGSKVREVQGLSSLVQGLAIVHIS